MLQDNYLTCKTCTMDVLHKGEYGNRESGMGEGRRGRERGLESSGEWDWRGGDRVEGEERGHKGRRGKQLVTATTITALI